MDAVYDEKTFYLEYIDRLKSEQRHEQAIIGKLKEHFSNFTKRLKDRDEVWNEFKLITDLEVLIQTIKSTEYVTK